MPVPFVSVIIPCGGKADRTKNLHYVLVGLEQQTFKEFEVVVINDGSSVDYLSIIQQHPDLHVKYVWQPKYEPNTGNMPPRNTGALLARADYILTLDSDNVLEKSALAYYVEDIECVPDRVVCGKYDWLPPMEITEQDIIERWNEIIDHYDDPYFQECPKRLPHDASHNIMRDLRTQFSECTVTELHDGMNDALAVFGGNSLFPKDIWFDCGGNADWLMAGLCDDGALGLELMFRGYKISFDGRIKAGHLWHPRNLSWVQQMSRLEVDKLDKVYHLGNYKDGNVPEHIAKEYHSLQKRYYRAVGYKYDSKLDGIAPKVQLDSLNKRNADTLEKAKKGKSGGYSVVQPQDDPTIYIMVEGWLHGLTCMEVFEKLGYRPQDVKIVHPDEVAECEKGTPITMEMIGGPSLSDYMDVPKDWSEELRKILES